MNGDRIPLCIADEDCPAADFARGLAAKLGIAVLDSRAAFGPSGRQLQAEAARETSAANAGTKTEPRGFMLAADAAGLGLRSMGERNSRPLRVDFAAAKIQHRAGDALHRQHLPRAVGAKGKVVDATAGLGRDAFLLASAGHAVWLRERDPVIYALLADGLRRAAAEPDLASIIDRMKLSFGDFRAWRAPALLDVVYLDPMFPAPGKRARGKKEMVYTRQIAADNDHGGLLDAGLRMARRRVVVKRPRREGFLDGLEPAFSYTGRLVRFDVYLP